MRCAEVNKIINKDNSRHAEYYEAILQVRPARQDVLDFVFSLVESRNDTKISKIKELKTGYDIYITNQRFSRGALATQLKKKFPKGKILITRSLYGRHKMTSKLVYRATILFRLNE